MRMNKPQNASIYVPRHVLEYRPETPGITTQAATLKYIEVLVEQLGLLKCCASGYR